MKKKEEKAKKEKKKEKKDKKREECPYMIDRRKRKWTPITSRISPSGRGASIA